MNSGLSFWKLPTYSQPSSRLGLKVRTFSNPPENVNYENALISNPSLNICWEKARTVTNYPIKSKNVDKDNQSAKEIKLAKHTKNDIRLQMYVFVNIVFCWNLKFDVNRLVIFFTVLAFLKWILTFSKSEFMGPYF